MSNLKYEYTDTGYCRVVYSWKNSKNQTVYYCAQDNGGGVVKFYRCTGGDWREPEYEIDPKEAPPFSPNDTSIDKTVNQWINEKWNTNLKLEVK